MSELQSPRRKSYTAKAIFGLLLAVVMVAAFATAGAAENSGTPRSGELHVTKECSQYSGLPGGFCTITGSNLNAIDVGMKVVYASAPNFVTLTVNSDLVLDGPGNNDAYGHVVLDLQTFDGEVATYEETVEAVHHRRIDRARRYRLHQRHGAGAGGSDHRRRGRRARRGQAVDDAEQEPVGHAIQRAQ